MVTAQVNLSLDPNVVELAKQKCQEQNIKLSHFINSILKDWVRSPQDSMPNNEIIMEKELRDLNEDIIRMSSRREEIKARLKQVEKEDGIITGGNF